MPPSVTIDDEPTVSEGPLFISPNVYNSTQNDFNNCPGSCAWCGLPELGHDPGACSFLALTAGNTWNAGYLSQQNWGSHGLARPTRSQSGMGINPAAPERAQLDEPFPLGELAHFNILIRGDSPTMIGLGGWVTVELPAGDPLVLPIGTSTWPLEDPSEDFPAVPLEYLETDNDPPCDPAIQVSPRPCDDRWRIAPGSLAPAPVSVDGVTFQFTHLGFRKPDGTFTDSLSTEEEKTTTALFYAKITASSNPTTTALAVAEGPALTATVSPAPWTGDGTVELRAGGQPIAGCDEVSVDPATGAAACSPTTLEPGTHSVTAAYSGGVGFAASESDAVDVVVSPGPAELKLKVKRAKLGKALRKGLVVRVSDGEPGSLRLVGRRAGRKVARGGGRIADDGTGSVRVEFTRAAKRRFSKAQRLRLKISGGGAAVKVTLRR